MSDSSPTITLPARAHNLMDDVAVIAKQLKYYISSIETEQISDQTKNMIIIIEQFKDIPSKTKYTVPRHIL